jgi:hypothetical protein
MSSYVGAGIILLVVAVALLMFFCTLVLKKNLRGWMKKSFLKPILFGLCLLLIVGGGVLFAYDYSMHSRVVSTNREQGIMYPEIDESLSEARQILLRQIRHQYDDPLAPTEYSDGIVEPWCADFVSYVILQASLHGAGEAFKNPHSGSWRIPGVYTMREYFESKGEFYTVDSDYLPRPGDVVFYDGGTFGTHVNFVVWSDAGEDEFLDNDEIYTVGGNENGKILLSSVYYRFEKYGVIGFGRIVE